MFFIGPVAYNFGYWGAGGAALGAGASATTASFIGSVAGGALAGAATGAVAGGLYGGWDGVLQGAKFGAIGGAILGPVNAFYETRGWSIGRVAANSLAGGVSSEAQGGGFKEGAMFSFATSATRYAYNSLAGYDVSIKPGDGPTNPGDGNGRYKYQFVDNLIPLNPAGNMGNIMGLNAELVNTGNGWNDFWANIGKQGAFPGNVLNYVLPAGNAIGVLHDTAWHPYETYFNPVTNWGTMVPAAVVTYGAVLDGPTRVLSPHAIDRMRR